MTARRIPLAHVRSGRLVRARGTGWEPVGDLDQSVAAARTLYAASEELYLVDLDGQFNGAANLEFLQALERQRVFPWVDAGCRKPEDAIDVLFAGAESITVQLRHLSPEMMEEVQEVSEASFYVGFTADAQGLEKRIRPTEILSLVERVGATGVVFYEGEGANLHAAENAAFEIQRGGVPVLWVSRPGSKELAHALASKHFAAVAAPEAAP